MPTCPPATPHMRDAARFHFGFTVPFVPHVGAAGVVAAVSESKGDLGLVPAFAAAGAQRLVGGARIRDRAEDHRAAAVRRSRRPSGGAAGVRGLARARRRHGEGGGDVERARRRLGHGSGACARRPGGGRSRFRTAPSTAPRCSSRCRRAAASRPLPTTLVKAGAERALLGPRRQPRDPLYGPGRRPAPGGRRTGR